jgi:hypothetical protein
VNHCIVATPTPGETVLGELAMRWPNTFKSGDVVPTSGVYKVLHSTPHMLIEHEMCLEGSKFRSCKVCPLGLIYRLHEPGVPTAFPILSEGNLAA